MKNIIIFFTLMLLFTKASSQESVVYVDIDYIMTNSKVGKNLNSQIEKTHKNNISFLVFNFWVWVSVKLFLT